jgi:hypothetical protein
VRSVARRGHRASALLLLVLAVVAFATARADAFDGHAGPVAVSVVSATDQAGARVLRVDARAPAGTVVYEIRAHVCLPGRNVHTNFDFGFDGRVCPNVAIGGGDVDPSAAFPNGVSEGRLDVRVGRGSAHWVNELGYPGAIDCDAAHSCDLVVRLQITDATAFFSVPLCDGVPCAGAGGAGSSHSGHAWVWILVSGAVLLGAAWIVSRIRRPSRVPVT